MPSHTKRGWRAGCWVCQVLHGNENLLEQLDEQDKQQEKLEKERQEAAEKVCAQAARLARHARVEAGHSNGLRLLQT